MSNPIPDPNADQPEKGFSWSETLFQGFFETMPLGVLFMDAQGRIVSANPKAERILGLRIAQMLGHFAIDPQWTTINEQGDIIPEELRPENVALRTGKPVRDWVMGVFNPVKSSLQWLQLDAIPLVGPGMASPYQVYIAFQDITARKKSEEALHESQGKLKLLLDSTAEAIYGIDLKGQCTFCNRAFLKMMGYDRTDQVLGRNMHDLIHHYDAGGNPMTEKECPIFKAFKGGCGTHVDDEVLWRADGSSFPAEYWSFPQVSEGKVVGPVVTFIDISQRRQAERGLEASEAWHRAILETAMDGYMVLDEAGRILQTNEAYASMTGYPVETLLRMRVADLEATETPDEVTARIQRIFATGRQRFDTRQRRKDGQEMDVEVSVQVIGGKEWRFLAFMRDVTARNRAESEIRANQARLAEAQTIAHLGSWEFDLETKTGVWSPELWRMLELDPSKHSVSRMLLLSRVHPEDLTGVIRIFEEALANGTSVRTVHRLKFPDGHIKYVEARAQFLCNKEGKPLRSHGTILDITDLKKAEDAHRESEARLQILSDNLPGGMVYQVDVGQDGTQRRFTYVSAGVMRLHGVTPDEVLQDPMALYNQIIEEDRVILAEKEAIALRTLAPFFTEARFRHHSGEIRWYWLVSSPRRLPNHHILWDGIELDITDRKKAEEQHRMLSAQLQQTQKMESLGSLAGGVAHDLNNVLSAILSLSTAFQDRFSTQDPMGNALETISSACIRGRNVIKSLMVFARRNLNEEGPVDLNALVKDTVHLLSHTTLKRAKLLMALEEGLPGIQGDASALNHVLINLCVNAVDAMPEGGTLTLSTRQDPNGHLLLSVRDTGKGMSPDVLQRAMEPFYTTKTHGTGLGLSMVYGTMKAHDGAVAIHSHVGKGTEVELLFPASRILMEAPVESISKNPPKAPSARQILLVDDDELIRMSTCSMLEMLGHRVVAASGGREALDCLTAGFKADLVILDLNMPGMSGGETLPQILALCPGQKVLIASGYMDESARTLQTGRPTVRFIAKPYTLDELKRAMAAWERTSE